MRGRRQARAVTHRLQDAIQVEHRKERGGQGLGGGEELLPTTQQMSNRDHGWASGCVTGYKRAPARMMQQG